MSKSKKYLLVRLMPKNIALPFLDSMQTEAIKAGFPPFSFFLEQMSTSCFPATYNR